MNGSLESGIRPILVVSILVAMNNQVHHETAFRM